MHIDDFLHGVTVWEVDVVEEAPPQKCIWQFFLIIRCNDHDGTNFGFDHLASFVNEELHLVEFLQQVVREFNVRFIDFINQ